MSDSIHRDILRSSSILAVSQAVTVLSSLVKMKFVAVLLGPSGLGIAGLYTNVVQTAAVVSGLGINQAGTARIARVNTEPGDESLMRTRRALFWAALVLAGVGGLFFCIASGWIARLVLGADGRSHEFRWLSLGVVVMVASGSQGAVLTGLHRIGDLARVNVASGLFGTVFGVLAIWIWGSSGIIPMILIGPVITFASGVFYVSRIGSTAGYRAGVAQLLPEWRAMLPVGTAIMTSGLVVIISQLAVRTLIQRQFGSEALGQFQAAWAIGMTYLGFVLSAMGTDYYPRLSAAIGDRIQATRLINQQTEIALLICAPIIFTLLAFAPWLVRLLYTAEFEPAVEILRWQLLGDFLKLVSFPLGFVLLSAGRGRALVFTEVYAWGVFFLGVLVGLPIVGLKATGISFLLMYVVYLPLLWWLCRRIIGFHWTRAVRIQATVFFCAAIALDVLSRWSDSMGMAVGAVMAFGSGMWALIRLSELWDSPNGPLGRLSAVSAAIRRRLRLK